MSTPTPSLEHADGYTVCAYPHPGLPPERTEFTDLTKAEKAFTDAKFAAILWATRPPAHGLGWIKIKEKAAPPTPAGAAKPAVPAAAKAPVQAAPKLPDAPAGGQS